MKKRTVERADAGLQTLAEAFSRHEVGHRGRSSVSTAVVLLRFDCGCLVMTARGVDADVEGVAEMLETYAAGLRQDPNYMMTPGEMHLGQGGEPS